MEQFMQVGEALGSLNTLMIFRHEIQINQRQCILLCDSFNLAFVTISEEIKNHLRLDEKATKWKPLENPLRELRKVFSDGESYVKNCLEATKNFWGKAIALSHNSDCVHLHLHNLLWCVFIVLEVIEGVSEISGTDQKEMNKKKIVFSKKYDKDLMMDSVLFRHKFGRIYLVNQEMCKRFDSVIKEDRWVLSELLLSEKREMVKKRRISEVLLSPRTKIHPCSVLVGSPDYQVRRRLEGSCMTNYKEIQWMGESFTMKHAIREAEVKLVLSDYSLHSSLGLAHPNVMNYLYAFCNEDEKKECYILMEFMNRDLASHIKEVCSLRRRVPFPLLVAVDIMLQVARGMECLHARKIYHGDLNPLNILVKTKNVSSPDSYIQVKVANFGVSTNKCSKHAVNQTAATTAINPCIWYAPEVLSEQEQLTTMVDTGNISKYSEKADVYSFGMICFELLTGKIPFEESHLQGDKMSRNIRAGERPLFSAPSPRYLVNLTRRCWQSNPLQRPSFSSICRVLRYIKRFLIINPDVGESEPVTPSMDYFDLEMGLKKRVVNWEEEFCKVSEIPFELYAYRVMERERTNTNFAKEKSPDSGGDGDLICGEENGFNSEELLLSMPSSEKLSDVDSDGRRKATLMKKVDGKANKQTGQHQKERTVKSPMLSSCARSLRMNSGDHLHRGVMSPRRSFRHTSD